MSRQFRGFFAAATGSALFSVIAFVVPFTKEMPFWIGYVFGEVSIILFAIVCFAADPITSNRKSRFYGWPLIYIATCHLVVQLIASFFFMIVPSIPNWIPYVTSITLLCLSLLGLIGTDTTVEQIQKIDAEVKQKIVYIRGLQAEIEGMADICSDSETLELLKELSEAIRYSDPMSHDSLADLERQMQNMCTDLSCAIDEAQWEEAKHFCKKLSVLLKQRNRMCLLLK